VKKINNFFTVFLTFFTVFKTVKKINNFFTGFFLVLGRFWESIHKDLILLVIFAGEREDSIQIQRIDSELVTIPLPKSAKKKALTNFVLE
jgi:hypothetical protein